MFGGFLSFSRAQTDNRPRTYSTNHAPFQLTITKAVGPANAEGVVVVGGERKLALGRIGLLVDGVLAGIRNLTRNG